MAIGVPVTVGTEITRSFSARQSSSLNPPGPEKVSTNPFLSDTITLSKLASEKLRDDSLLETSEAQELTPTLVGSVGVTSSAGLSRSRGGLSAQQAIILYQRVSSLL